MPLLEIPLAAARILYAAGKLIPLAAANRLQGLEIKSFYKVTPQQWSSGFLILLLAGLLIPHCSKTF